MIAKCEICYCYMYVICVATVASVGSDGGGGRGGVQSPIFTMKCPPISRQLPQPAPAKP